MESKNKQHRGLRISRREEMLVPDDIGKMQSLHGHGWGSKRIARELGVARNTVKRYLAAGGHVPTADAPGQAGRS
jgi:hypothetical protein